MSSAKGGYASRKEFNNRKTALIQTICGIPKPTLTTVIFGMALLFLIMKVFLFLLHALASDYFASRCLHVDSVERVNHSEKCVQATLQKGSL